MLPLCNLAVLPLSEQSISIELTSCLAQMNHLLKCAERSTHPLRRVREKPKLEDWSKNRDIVNACNSAKL